MDPVEDKYGLKGHGKISFPALVTFAVNDKLEALEDVAELPWFIDALPELRKLPPPNKFSMFYKPHHVIERCLREYLRSAYEMHQVSCAFHGVKFRDNVGDAPATPGYVDPSGSILAEGHFVPLNYTSTHTESTSYEYKNTNVDYEPGPDETCVNELWCGQQSSTGSSSYSVQADFSSPGVLPAEVKTLPTDVSSFVTAFLEYAVARTSWGLVTGLGYVWGPYTPNNTYADYVGAPEDPGQDESVTETAPFESVEPKTYDFTAVADVILPEHVLTSRVDHVAVIAAGRPAVYGGYREVTDGSSCHGIHGDIAEEPSSWGLTLSKSEQGRLRRVAFNGEDYYGSVEVTTAETKDIFGRIHDLVGLGTGVDPAWGGSTSGITPALLVRLPFNVSQCLREAPEVNFGMLPAQGDLATLNTRIGEVMVTSTYSGVFTGPLVLQRMNKGFSSSLGVVSCRVYECLTGYCLTVLLGEVGPFSYATGVPIICHRVDGLYLRLGATRILAARVIRSEVLSERKSSGDYTRQSVRTRDPYDTHLYTTDSGSKFIVANSAMKAKLVFSPNTLLRLLDTDTKEETSLDAAFLESPRLSVGGRSDYRTCGVETGEPLSLLDKAKEIPHRCKIIVDAVSRSDNKEIVLLRSGEDGFDSGCSSCEQYPESGRVTWELTGTSQIHKLYAKWYIVAAASVFSPSIRTDPPDGYAWYKTSAENGWQAEDLMPVAVTEAFQLCLTGDYVISDGSNSASYRRWGLSTGVRGLSYYMRYVYAYQDGRTCEKTINSCYPHSETWEWADYSGGVFDVGLTYPVGGASGVKILDLPGYQQEHLTDSVVGWVSLDDTEAAVSLNVFPHWPFYGKGGGAAAPGDKHTGSTTWGGTRDRQELQCLWSLCDYCECTYDENTDPYVVSTTADVPTQVPGVPLSAVYYNVPATRTYVDPWTPAKSGVYVNAGPCDPCGCTLVDEDGDTPGPISNGGTYASGEFPKGTLDTRPPRIKVTPFH
jgi:hypothetical protein